MAEAKRRCKWRARRIAWCRKYGKFCNAPFEYETCPGYEPIEGHGTVTLGKVRRNIRLLRDQILPVETKGWEEAFPETLRLKPLFDMEDRLIEHKFPHEKSAIIDWIISCPGDIYRNITHGYPDFGYIMEKWERLSSYAARPPLSKLQAGDWEEIKTQIHDPSYKTLRDQYLSNLQRLREETLKMPMDPKRSTVMVESLDMIKALILWFESLDPYEPPRQQLDRLTDAIAKYFPREFFEGSRVQIPPSVTPVSRSCKVESAHPDIVKYVPGMPKEAYVCVVRKGITGRSIGRPEWGYVATIDYDYQPNEKVGYIQFVFVWDEFRHRGYGKLLVDSAVEDMKNYGIEKVYTAPVRPGSPEFFSALTFKPYETTPLYYKEILVRQKMGMLNIDVKHPSITSMYNITMAPTLELKSRHGPELKQMISEAEGQKREIGVMLCRNPAGDIHLSRACWGLRGKVEVHDCKDHLSPLGSFHTHLSGVANFSVPDLKLAVRKEELSCLGYSKGGQPYLKCILPKRYYDYPSSQRAEINRMLSEAESYIERASQLFRTSPHSTEARMLSERAIQWLSAVEKMLDVSEVQL